jgi:hypothetical protein
MIDLCQKPMEAQAGSPKDYYPEISVPIKGMKKITPDMMDQDMEVTCVIRPCGLDKEKVRFEIRSIDLGKGPAKSIDEAVDNAAEESDESDQEETDKGEKD